MKKFVLFAAFFALFALSGCRYGCQNRKISEQLSPDERWKWVTFDRNCGPNSRSNLQISVISAVNPLPDGSGNVFIADDPHSPLGPVAHPQWIAPHTLRITYSQHTHVLKMEKQVGEIQIEYVSR